VIKVLNGHSDAVRACGFSRDGNMIVTGAYDHRLMVSTRPAPPPSPLPTKARAPYRTRTRQLLLRVP